MAFILEDGIGRRGANSYVPLGFAQDYTTERGRTEFDGLADSALKILLIRATDYIELRWGQRFTGCRKTTTQGLSWPRLYAYDRDGVAIARVPEEICKATVELAQRAKGLSRLLADPPAPYPVTDASGAVVDVASGELLSETRTVGPITKRTTYAHSGLRSRSIITAAMLGGVTIQSFPEVERLILPLLAGSGEGVIRN